MLKPPYVLLNKNINLTWLIVFIFEVSLFSETSLEPVEYLENEKWNAWVRVLI